MTKPIQRIVILLSLFLLVNFTVYAKNDLSFKKEMSVSASDISKLSVDVGSGSLNIQGNNIDEILVVATIKSDKYSDLEDLQQALANKMTLSLESNGSDASLKAINKSKLFNFKNPNIQIDLDVTVPNKINIFVDDGSGNMKISDIKGNIKIDDGSGSLVIENIAGDVLIDDGSGNQVINNIVGNVTIDDGSGSVEMKSISGNVSIDDGSGSINIDNLSGEFKLIDGGSGSVFVNGKKWIE